MAVFAAAEPRLHAALAGTAAVPGVNPATASELRALLARADLIGADVAIYEDARRAVMGAANEIIGRTTTTEAELRAVLALTESSGSTGSIGERFVGLRLTSPLYSATDVVHPTFTRAELPGLRGPGQEFIPDRIIAAARESLDVKTGYTPSIDIVDQAHNYDLLARASAATDATGAAIRSRLGGQSLTRHSWLVLPGRNAGDVSARSVAQSIFDQLQTEGLTTQRVFYLDDAGVIQQITGAGTQTAAGATIHHAVGLPFPPPPPP